jgi:hypothetical protein
MSKVVVGKQQGEQGDREGCSYHDILRVMPVFMVGAILAVVTSIPPGTLSYGMLALSGGTLTLP